jgi:hypothetical protein
MLTLVTKQRTIVEGHGVPEFPSDQAIATGAER